MANPVPFVDELHFASVKQLANAIQDRRVRAADVMQAYLDRIAAINPAINAVVLLAPDAREQARQSDADLDSGIVRGPLHGVPFSVVDIIGTANLTSELDRRIRRREPPRTDATVVARLRAAGAILLAKTNCPPAGRGRDTENAITGRTLNPYQPQHTPGGGSGGEAALVAAGGSPLAWAAMQGVGCECPLITAGWRRSSRLLAACPIRASITTLVG
ncbi:MAG: amidase [Caldilineaceae bacterium]|nr:amidase [Caldilineaceae bacterium]